MPFWGGFDSISLIPLVIVARIKRPKGRFRRFGDRAGRADGFARSLVCFYCAPAVDKSAQMGGDKCELVDQIGNAQAMGRAFSPCGGMG